MPAIPVLRAEQFNPQAPVVRYEYVRDLSHELSQAMRALNAAGEAIEHLESLVAATPAQASSGDKNSSTQRTDAVAKSLGRETYPANLRIAMAHARQLERELADKLEENAAKGWLPGFGEVVTFAITPGEIVEILKALRSEYVVDEPKHLQDAPRTLRNVFKVRDPNDPDKFITVVYASFAVCLEREANQLRTKDSNGEG